MVKEYIPEKGDIVWLEFDPQKGYEQKGRRPALVLTPKIYNQKTKLAIFCPITSKIKGYPFEVLLPANFPLKGVILVDQIKSLDWKRRKAQFICKLNEDLFKTVLEKIFLLLSAEE